MEETKMRRVIVRYRVKADKAAENRRLVEAVFAELRSKQPDGLRYTSFVQEDGVSFVHISSIETSDGHNPLAETEAFKAFQKDILERCEEAPVAVELEAVGSYRMLGE